MDMTNTELLVELAQRGLYLALLLSAPALATAMVVGLIISVFQAATQIHEHTLSFAPKLLAVSVALAVFAPWIGDGMREFTRTLWELIPRLSG